MNTLAIIEQVLARWCSPRLGERGVDVRTHCLYPSNSTVNVCVQGRADTFIVDDNGGAIAEMYASIPAAADVSRQFSSLIKRYGLRTNQQGYILSPPVKPEELAATILLVANASKDAAGHFVDKMKPPRRNFRAAIELILDRRFHNQWRSSPKIAGASNKLHTFDFVVNLKDDRQLVLDFVVPEPSSINAAVVAHMDVSNAIEKPVEQKIIYDDTQCWKASDLALLKAGSRASVIPFSALERSLDKLAA